MLYSVFITLLALAPLAFLAPLGAQTIAEKKASLITMSGDLDKDSEQFLVDVNRELLEDQRILAQLYTEAERLYKSGADVKEYETLLAKINQRRANIEELENSWRLLSLETNSSEPYALWHQPDTTIGQLVVDYGSQDYVYLMPKELSDMKLSISSNLPIPRSAWNEMLGQILTQNGVGMRQINPFLRELFLIKNDKSGIKLITNRRADLTSLPQNSRVAYVLSPDPSDVRRTYFFLDNFVNHSSTVVQLVGRDILIIGEVQAISDLLKLSDFVGENRGEIEWRAISLSRISPEEMSKILAAIFNPAAEKEKTFIAPNKKNAEPTAPPDANGLKVIKLSPPASGLFLVGTREEIKKAEGVIRDVEGQIGSAREKVIHWYTAKYSDPDELADVLSKIYTLMIKTGTGNARAKGPQDYLAMANQLEAIEDNRPDINIVNEGNIPADYFPEDDYFEQGFPISPAPVRAPTGNEKKRVSNRTNFIVDSKTSSIVMVVEADILSRLKDLIKKLDVPKMMVQLEVLLFERKCHNKNEFGLNLLRLGGCADNVHRTCAKFSDTLCNKTHFGVFDFLISRTKNHAMPAFDLIYRFLLSQNDVTINASPSVVAVNQTPAFIAVLEEQSIDTGAYQLEDSNVVALAAFKRAQYGVTIEITPTIHLRNEEDEEPYDSITLVSDIVFDTEKSNIDNRPIVIRRKIKNEARVADGETIILGGLRRKDTEDFKDVIPFLGEIPGVGKLFSLNRINDMTTEMFIFITPKIIRDPSCDLESIRQEEMCRRPGDLPEFMTCLVQAQKEEKERLFQHTMTMLFGREDERLISPDWHNDDTCQFPDGPPPCYPAREYDGR